MNRRRDRKGLGKEHDENRAKMESVPKEEPITNPEFVSNPIEEHVNEERMTYFTPEDPPKVNQVISSKGNLRKQSQRIPFKHLKQIRSVRGTLPDVTTFLNGYDYMSLNDPKFYASKVNITDLTMRISNDSAKQINVSITNGEGTSTYTTFDGLKVGNDGEQIIYTDTTNYTRGENATLLPLDVINLYNDHVDIGIYCAEIYKSENSLLKRIDGAEIITKIGENNYLVNGGNYNPDDETKMDDKLPVYMSVVKDTCGNCYVVKNEVKLEAIERYLVKDSNSTIAPTNMSCYLGPNSSRPNDWEVVPTSPIESYPTEKAKRLRTELPDENGAELSSFECFVRGYLFFNSNEKQTGNENEDGKPHFTAIWLETPTLFSVTKYKDSENNWKRCIKIGDFIKAEGNITDSTDSTDSTSTKYDLYCNKVAEGREINSCLPLESDFYHINFGTENLKKLQNVEIKIQSLAKWFN